SLPGSRHRGRLSGPRTPAPGRCLRCVLTPRGTPTSGFLLLCQEDSFLLLVQVCDANPQDGVAHADLVAVAQTHGPAGQAVRFRGRARGALLADPFAVDVGAVKAAQVGDADLGRGDLQQAVMS